jgi:hypothetical protein
MQVNLTQFIRPNGRQRQTFAEVSDDLRARVEAIRAAGLRFTAEDLGNGKVSLCIENDEEDLAIEIADNGPGENSPTVALERLIRSYRGTLPIHSVQLPNAQG